MSAEAGGLRPFRVWLPPEMEAYLEQVAQERGTCTEEVMCRAFDAWFAAGRPDPGVPDVLATSGLITARQVNTFRALIWWMAQSGIPVPLL